jgi:Tol biopolymer transport system component
VSDWSTDGKRLLTTAQSRVAWVNADGSGELDYITSEEEVAYSAKLSPDGKRILCMAAPKPQNGERARLRLCVINLSTKHRTIVDKPGETHGYCWSPDGSKIAYTWQRSLDNPSEVEVREAFLITCSADGSDQTTITSRKYGVPQNSSGRDGTIIFFTVLDWR